MRPARDAAPAAAPAAKQDPETLVLRGRPPPVARFRRGLIVSLAGAACVGVATIAWTALEPASFRMEAAPDAEASLGKIRPEALAEAPSSYGDVPQLGPPLPGDLGRPILEHRRAAAAEEPGLGTEALQRARAAAQADEARLASEQDAARGSGLLVRLAGPRAAGPAEPDAPRRSGESGAEPVPAARDGAEAGRPVATATAGVPSPGLTLSAGSVIPASLITGIDSDLPGIVIAQVTEHVRDSRTGLTVLIPQGARLIGRYDSDIAYGQRRALLAWQRVVLPNGASIELNDMPATDPSGRSGLAGQVDTHGWRLLKGIALSTLLGIGTELSLRDESEVVRAVRESAQQGAARAGDAITRRNLDVQPTLRVRPGWPVRAVLHRDLVLPPWRG